MTKKQKLITVSKRVEFDEAKDILHKNRIEKLPIVDAKGKLKGLITMTDVTKTIKLKMIFFIGSVDLCILNSGIAEVTDQGFTNVPCKNNRYKGGSPFSCRIQRSKLIFYRRILKLTIAFRWFADQRYDCCKLMIRKLLTAEVLTDIHLRFTNEICYI